jgi:GDPmannose 4,6-dehydratase
MMQHDKADDFVLGTGETHSVREFVELAFAEVGVKIDWSGSGTEEIGANAKTGDVLIRIDPRYFRPTEVDLLIADPSKAKRDLDWAATTSFADLVSEMVKSDLSLMAPEMPRG